MFNKTIVGTLLLSASLSAIAGNPPAYKHVEKEEKRFAVTLLAGSASKK